VDTKKKDADPSFFEQLVHDESARDGERESSRRNWWRGRISYQFVFFGRRRVGGEGRYINKKRKGGGKKISLSPHLCSKQQHNTYKFKKKMRNLSAARRDGKRQGRGGNNKNLTKKRRGGGPKSKRPVLLSLT